LTVVSVEHSNIGCTNPDEFGVTDTALDDFAKGHHSTHQTDTELIHVYAIAGKPVFTDHDHWDFDVQVPWAGGVWKLKGYIDLKTTEIDANFSVKFPIIPEIRLAHVKGNLTQGVQVTFSIGSIVSGTAKFYIKDKHLWVDLSAKVWGHQYGPISIKLIPI